MKYNGKRRNFILGSSSGLVAVLNGGYAQSQSLNPPPQKINTLQAILDTLIPRDDALGALDMHLDTTFDAYRQRHRTWHARADRLVEFCEVLALKEHNTTFSTLEIKQREVLLTSVLRDPQLLQFRMDLSSMRGLVFRWYYETETGRQSIGYRLPSDYPAYAKTTVGTNNR